MEKNAGEYEITLKELRTPREGDRARIDAMTAAIALADEAAELREKGDAASLNSAIAKDTEVLALWRTSGRQALGSFDTPKYRQHISASGRKKRSLSGLRSGSGDLPFAQKPQRSGAHARADGEPADSINATPVERRKALDYHTQALPLLREIGDREHEADTLNYIGLIYGALGDHGELKYSMRLWRFRKLFPIVMSRRRRSTTPAGPTII